MLVRRSDRNRSRSANDACCMSLSALVEPEKIKDVAVLEWRGVYRLDSVPQVGRETDVFLLYRFEFSRRFHLEQRRLFEPALADDVEIWKQRPGLQAGRSIELVDLVGAGTAVDDHPTKPHRIVLCLGTDRRHDAVHG